MILDWPASLPKPERETWAFQPMEARRRRATDAGPPAWRRRFSAVAEAVTLSVLLDRSQKAVFDRFFAVDCARGAHLFRMPDPTTDGWPMLTAAGAPVLTGSGQPVLLSAIWLCAWGETAPAEAIVGDVEFRKTFPILVLP